MPEIRSLDLGELSAHDSAVVFKHSPTCPLSWAARSQVESFKEHHPSVPVYTISVRADRELAQRITAWTKVKHESPQVIVLRHGAVVSTASHGAVTAQYLAHAISTNC